MIPLSFSGQSLHPLLLLLAESIPGDAVVELKVWPAKLVHSYFHAAGRLSCRESERCTVVVASHKNVRLDTQS